LRSPARLRFAGAEGNQRSQAQVYNTTWSDEFNGSYGSPNTANWFMETGNNNGWGNNELESKSLSAETMRILEAVAQAPYVNSHPFSVSAKLPGHSFTSEGIYLPV
jgi:hypothetical protein